MKYLYLSLFLAIFAGGSAQAEDIVSSYTDLDVAKDCSVFAKGSAEEGDWRNLVCSGYKGYPVLIYYSDARESLFYGLPPDSSAETVWESFAGFNSAGPTIEWRIATDGDLEIPFATIHRWFVAARDESQKDIEVLVVEKVAQIGVWESCVVGLVVATGNPGANEQARQLADTRARGFNCGTDLPAVMAGSVPLPDFTRQGG